MDVSESLSKNDSRDKSENESAMGVELFDHIKKESGISALNNSEKEFKN